MDDVVSGAWAIVLQGGALGVMFLVLIAIMFGYIRTRQELQAVQERAQRAEALVDTLIPSVDKLTDAVSTQTQILGRVSLALDQILLRPHG